MKFTWRKVFLSLAVIGLLAIVAIGALIASEWTYITRLRTRPEKPITTADWYQPKQTIPGAPRGDLPIASLSEIEITPAAISNAWAFAEKKNSAALLIVHKGKLVYEKYSEGRTRESWTDSASMAKTVAAILIGIAIDSGKIASVDEPAAKYIPAWRKDGRAKITLRHLLQMHSGLRPMGDYTDPFSDACYLAMGTDARYVVEGCPLVTEPGTKFDYNNVNFQALGFVIEAATHTSYADYLSEVLWKPLGNYDAAVGLDRANGNAHASGFLFARAQDWARVGLMLLHDGAYDGRRIVSRNWVLQMLTSSPTEPDYGLGIWLGKDGIRKQDRDEPFLAQDMFYLDGKDKQRVYIIPSRDVIIVRLGENARGFDEATLPNAILRGIKP